jgi:uncharacterized membrane protein YeiH
LAYGISDSYAVVLGVMSATFGGLIADLLSGRQPSLFQKGELYATASAIGGIIYILLKHLHVSANLSLNICVCSGSGSTGNIQEKENRIAAYLMIIATETHCDYGQE